jgi:cytoskeletal protein CcmA (bactofilin family)
MTNPYDSATERVSVLGPTLSFKGEMSADEELLIHGRVEGSIGDAKRLTVASDGVVKAEVHAAVVIIEGAVEGDVHAKTSVVVKDSAKVRGNLNAPAVSIQEGASFNGGISMEPANGQLAGAASAAAPAAPAPFMA